MLPDSARELKARLSQRLSGVLPGEVVASSLGGATRWSGVALGLRPVGPDQVHLAIRLIDQRDADVVLAGLDEAAREEVDVRVIGPVRLLSSPDSFSPAALQRRERPLRPGQSVSHRDVTAGTLGGFVRRPGTDGLLVLSNSHVLADSGAGDLGDPVLQPGVADGGRPGDRVGTLAGFLPFSDEPGNLVDAAVATLDAGVAADPTAYPGGALLARVTAPEEVDPDEVVEKVGRTTGHTRGRITAVEVDGVGVQYDDGVHTFDDQVEVEGLTGGFSAGGDSGSVIWRSRDRAPLGLLFAGSAVGGSAGGGVTFANPLATVLQRLGVDWVAG
ncbi:S1 family peptidase [Modestobacter sp. L9-4]|uniref:S1 family peptidase n=1 Tax=Modestobacter sp. L9-4 TaxID=2851567 RepID=UPI001C7504D1|nr:S1 family peptidase [Modestobacter sp. L9-4]QXG77316.1 S1 family peptidase [Modestobacter sp. L9-4]